MTMCNSNIQINGETIFERSNLDSGFDTGNDADIDSETDIYQARTCKQILNPGADLVFSENISNNESELWTSKLKQQLSTLQTVFHLKPKGSECTETDDESITSALRSGPFYVLWITNGCTAYGVHILSMFYKSFGQTRINDDHFLAAIGTLDSALVFVTRLLCGLLADKMGVKSSLIILCGAQSLAFACWYLTASAGRWPYLVCTSVLAVAGHGIFTVTPVAVLKHFGSVRLTTLMSLTFTSTVVAGVLVSAARELLLANSGWLVFLTSDALLMLLPLLLVACYLP
ncbi:uncharacterized protein LOC101855710 [Aplysia californica]|uniref:Uncharacterized protein LOC101855710 n=1 Tax=Aplysia californica TaxID=6500 RepID=A0ABM0JIT0_APLCA|nr:uncharacterized protein LOC101855710 [Aplysia californica]